MKGLEDKEEDEEEEFIVVTPKKNDKTPKAIMDKKELANLALILKPNEKVTFDPVKKKGIFLSPWF